MDTVPRCFSGSRTLSPNAESVRACLRLSALYPELLSSPWSWPCSHPASSFGLLGICTRRSTCSYHLPSLTPAIPQNSAPTSSPSGSLPHDKLSSSSTCGAHFSWPFHSRAHCLSVMFIQQTCMKHLCADTVLNAGEETMN